MIGLFQRLLNDAVEAAMRIFQALVMGILTAPFRALFGTQDEKSDEEESPSPPEVQLDAHALPSPPDESDQAE